MNPIVTSSPSTWKPRVAKGMRNSANQPSSLWLVTTSQNEFQSEFDGMPARGTIWASLKTVRSMRFPEGLVTNQTPVSKSL